MMVALFFFWFWFWFTWFTGTFGQSANTVFSSLFSNDFSGTAVSATTVAGIVTGVVAGIGLLFNSFVSVGIMALTQISAPLGLG